MPLYDYQCRECGHIFEAARPIEFIETSCTICSGIADRLFSMTKFTPPKPFICNDLGVEPVQINNLNHLERECNKRGLSYEIGPTRYTKRERPREKLKKKVANAISSHNA